LADNSCEADLDVMVLRERGAIARTAAERIAHTAREAIGRRGRFTMVLSGGSTPWGLYQRLAGPDYASAMPWSATHLFWGDERCVPPDDERSNYRLARDAGLLARPLAGVHRMRGEDPPATGARAYEEELRAFFARSSRGAETTRPDSTTRADSTGSSGTRVPVFDVVLLGMGEDGHTASLFPGSSALEERERWVVSTQAHEGVARLTLTLPVLVAARRVVFLISGAEKAAPLREILSDPACPLPAGQVLWGAAHATVLADEAAGSAAAFGPRG
jgi:6-phosphogluconolactonase